MKIRLLLFANLAERLGFRQRIIDVEDGLSLMDFLKLLPNKLGFDSNILLDGKGLKNGLRVALNASFINDLSLKLSDLDEVAIIPPVSGG